MSHKQSQAQATLARVTTKREQLKTLILSKAKAKLAKCRSHFYEHSDKCGRTLARALKAKHTQSYITEVKGPGGERLIHTEEMVKAFCTYIAGLYNLDCPERAGPVASLKARTTSPTKLGDAPLAGPSDPGPRDPADTRRTTSGDRLHSRGKSPGPDGFMLVYYRTFSDSLSPHFLRAFNTVGEGQPFPLDTLRAHITIIPKKSKDPKDCRSYRPISLLNVDLKLFTKIIASRLSRDIASAIH